MAESIPEINTIEIDVDWQSVIIKEEENNTTWAENAGANSGLYTVSDNKIIWNNGGVLYKSDGNGAVFEIVNANDDITSTYFFTFGTLKKGTYVLNETLTLSTNIVNQKSFTGKFYYLTANNTYSEQTNIATISIAENAFSIIGESSATAYNSEPDEDTGAYWISTPDMNASYTATDTTKLRTIEVTEDQDMPILVINWFASNSTYSGGGDEPTEGTNLLYMGNSHPSSVYWGETEIYKIYFGETLVYEKLAPLPQLATPQNVSVENTTLSFDEVENAEEYEVFVDNVSIGSYQVSNGETWVLNSTIAAPSNSIDENINFLCVDTSQNFIRILVESEGKGVHLEYFAQGDSSTSGTTVSTGGTKVATKYRTLTFETAPTGDVLTWLQTNGVKQ